MGFEKLNQARPTDWLDLALEIRAGKGFLLLPWTDYAEHFSEPAVVDCFAPKSAQIVIETISEQSNETCALLFALAGMKASGEWNVN